MLCGIKQKGEKRVALAWKCNFDEDSSDSEILKGIFSLLRWKPNPEVEIWKDIKPQVTKLVSNTKSIIATYYAHRSPFEDFQEKRTTKKRGMIVLLANNRLSLNHGTMYLTRKTKQQSSSKRTKKPKILPTALSVRLELEMYKVSFLLELG